MDPNQPTTGNQFLWMKGTDRDICTTLEKIWPVWFVCGSTASLILDEATSALDNTTEVLIQQALDELCKGRTTLVVAHRLSTIRNADEIAVVIDGRITERGTHEELIAKGGTYKELYALQFRENDLFE